MAISSADINRYLQVPYVDCGRDLTGWDCWGLVRFILMQHYHLPDIGNFEHIHPDNKSALTRAFLCQKQSFVEASPADGAVIAGFKKNLCVHVGVVVNDGGALRVLHTARASGPSKIPLRRFAALFSRVKCYAHHSHLSQCA